MNFIYDFLFSTLKHGANLLLDIAKIEVATIYLKVLGHVHSLFIRLALVLLSLLLGMAGVVMAHVALFILLPWSIETRALILLGLASLYMLTAVLIFHRLCHEKNWMKAAGADAILDSLKK